MLVSWVDKKKSGLKNILMLTTMYDIVNVSRDERKKPHVMVFYGSTNGGVDVLNLHSSSISTRMKSRWTMNAFSFSLDTAGTNARTLHNEVLNISTSSFHFIWNLGKALVLPHIQRRHDVDRRSLPTLIVMKISTVLNIQNIPTPILPKPDQATSGGRCYICLAVITSRRDYKKRSKLKNHLQTFYHACEYTICKEHSYLICDNCHREQQER